MDDRFLSDPRSISGSNHIIFQVLWFQIFFSFHPDRWELIHYWSQFDEHDDLLWIHPRKLTARGSFTWKSSRKGTSFEPSTSMCWFHMFRLSGEYSINHYSSDMTNESEGSYFWVVVSKWFQIFFIFNRSWGNDPIWLIFFKWVETTN